MSRAFPADWHSASYHFGTELKVGQFCFFFFFWACLRIMVQFGKVFKRHFKKNKQKKNWLYDYFTRRIPPVSLWGSLGQLKLVWKQNSDRGAGSVISLTLGGELKRLADAISVNICRLSEMFREVDYFSSEISATVLSFLSSIMEIPEEPSAVQCLVHAPSRRAHRSSLRRGFR